MNTKFGLIADVGGTNARFALAPIKDNFQSITEEELLHIRTLSAVKFPNFEEAVKDYLASIPSGYERPKRGTIAIACPTDTDLIKMTNNNWAFSQSELRENLDFNSLLFINDFFAVACAVPYLDESQIVQIGDGHKQHLLPQVVTGPGTGLGLGAVIYDTQGHPVTVQGEGGHIHFAPVDETERFLLEYLLKKYPRVSVERLISGHGLENIYEGLQFKYHHKKVTMNASDISDKALTGEDEICVESLNYFCAIFGSFCGDAALMYGAKGGVYIGGGIIPKILDFFKASEFRNRFVDKARLSAFVLKVPTYVIISKQPGLLGAAAYLNS